MTHISLPQADRREGDRRGDLPLAAYYYRGMTLPPGRADTSRVVALDYEIAQEQASALGRAGRALEAALAALSDYDVVPAAGRDRVELVQTASDALWRFLVQRECCGLRDARQVIRDYRVPSDVQNRVGVFTGRRRTKPLSSL
jgi:hypothetical protein